MSTTIIGPISQEFPSTAVPAVVELKRTWSDQWTFVPELEFMGGNAATAGQDLDSAEFYYRYGVLKNPWEPSSSRKTPVALDGCWVRVCMAGRQGFQQAWLGRITGEGREVMGCSQGPTGIQRFEALGPGQMLRKISVGRSFWQIGGQTEELHWAAPLNERYGRTDKPGTHSVALSSAAGAAALGCRSGNRSASTVDAAGGACYVFADPEYGGKLWSYYEFARYLLAMFVDERDDGGPRWTLGGQAELLKYFSDPIQFGATQTADQILRRLIDPEYGLDYKIVAGDQGFEIFVFVLTKEPCGWGGHTLPGNPDTVRIYSSRTADNLSVQVSRTSAQRYGTIRILGDRIVVCGSLYTSSQMPGAGGMQTLVGLWNAQDRAAYDAGTGQSSDAPSLHDEARRQDRFRDVYRTWGASSNWFSSENIQRAPWWNGEGRPQSIAGPMQQHARSTLNWLPLESGVDYSTNLPNDKNESQKVPSLMLPQAWVYDSADDKYVPCDTVGIGVSVLPDRLGVFLSAQPNHLLGKGSFSGQSDYDPEWNTIAVTLAYQTDQRFFLEQKISDTLPSDGVLEIDASECQLWVLAKDTMLDVDAAGQPVHAPKLTILRNDWPRLAAKMAGAKARHFQDRARAQIVVQGLLPWGSLLGQILTVIDEGGSTQTIEAPITQVRWQGGDRPATIISTGFASE